MTSSIPCSPYTHRPCYMFCRNPILTKDQVTSRMPLLMKSDFNELFRLSHNEQQEVGTALLHPGDRWHAVVTSASRSSFELCAVI